MKVVLCCISLKFVFSGLSEAEVEYITAKLIQSQKENAIMKKYILINFFGKESDKIEHSRVTCISQITGKEIEVLKKYNIVNGRLI